MKMADKCNCNNNAVKDKVCIHTDKVYDSCREKDCLEDLRVYLTRNAQEIADKAISVRIKGAEIVWVYSDVEPVAFNKGYYTVSVKYFFKITLELFTGCGRPTVVEGLATFDKKIILYGSEGNARIYTSAYRPNEQDVLESVKTNLPRSVVEVVDPVVLSAKLVEKEKCSSCCDIDITSVPGCICRCFDDDLVSSGDSKTVYVTIGIFTIIKLERSVQLMIPVYDFCIPEKECEGSTDEDPCNIFKNLCFPVEEFFPPM
ncbi:MAG: hypothetical protein E7405_00125 [Ruminococcaceae bacterium]|nr:hypothetical protein [Oscillospiraceae bacterium]